MPTIVDQKSIVAAEISMGQESRLFLSLIIIVFVNFVTFNIICMNDILATF